MTPRPKLQTCPVCRSRKIKPIEGDFAVNRHGRKQVIHDLFRYECANCGEVFFDYESAKRLEESRQKAGRSA